MLNGTPSIDEKRVVELASTTDSSPSAWPEPSRKGSLSRPALIMAVGTFLSRVTGLGRLAAMAYAIGVAESRLADSFNIANTLPNVVYELILGGVLTSVFIPVLVEDIKTARDDQEASARVSSLFVGTMGALLLVTFVAIVAAPLLINLFAFRLREDTREVQKYQATFFFRFFATEIVFYGYTAVTAALLNSYHRFVATAFSPIANNIVVIATFLVFAKITPKQIAAAGTPPPLGMFIMALGTAGGVAAMAAAQWPAVKRLPLSISIRRGFAHLGQSSWPKLLRLSSWIFGFVVTNQIGFAIALVLANGVQGGPTAYFIAFAFFQLPIGLVAISIITAVVPSIAGLWVEKRVNLLARRLVRAVRAVSVLLAPMTAAYLVLGRPAVALLLERGVMSANSSQLVASTLAAFAVGIIPFSLWVLTVRCFYAIHDSKTPFVLNLLEVGVTVALDFVLYPRFQIAGLALAHSLGYFIGSAVSGWVLFRRLHQREVGRRLATPLLQIFFAGALCAAAGWIVLAKLRPWIEAIGDVSLSRIVELSVGGAAILAAFVLWGVVTRMEDLAIIKRILNPKELFADVEEAPVGRRVSG
ncbi:MAG: murein biosynthesis integral membrane protein MurJ [Acidimicrobiia bacterium]